jgi:hypothetical protein
MSQSQEKDRSSQHPTVREHPEQRRQEETGREDPEEASEVGHPPSESHQPIGRNPNTKKSGEAA